MLLSFNLLMRVKLLRSLAFSLSIELPMPGLDSSSYLKMLPMFPLLRLVLLPHLSPACLRRRIVKWILLLLKHPSRNVVGGSACWYAAGPGPMSRCIWLGRGHPRGYTIYLNSTWHHNR